MRMIIIVVVKVLLIIMIIIVIIILNARVVDDLYLLCHSWVLS